MRVSTPGYTSRRAPGSGIPLLQESGDGAVEVAATRERLPGRIQPILPPPDLLVRRQAVLGKDEFSARLENPADFTKGTRHVGQGAKSERHEDGVRAPVGQRIPSAEAFRNSTGSPAPRTLFPARAHSSLDGSRAQTRRTFVLVVERKVQPRTETLLPGRSQQGWNDFFPLPHHGSAAGDVHEFREEDRAEKPITHFRMVFFLARGEGMSPVPRQCRKCDIIVRPVSAVPEERSVFRGVFPWHARCYSSREGRHPSLTGGNDDEHRRHRLAARVRGPGHVHDAGACAVLRRNGPQEEHPGDDRPVARHHRPHQRRVGAGRLQHGLRARSSAGSSATSPGSGSPGSGSRRSRGTRRRFPTRPSWSTR